MKRIGIITALARERRTLGPRRVEAISDRILIATSGIGQDNAARAAQSLLAESVDALISWGTAGGLNPALHPGALVLGTSVHSTRGRCYQCDDQWFNRLAERLRQLGATGGRVYSPDTAISTQAEKRSVHNDHGFDIVDMESGAIAESASRANIPFAVIRCVVDSSDFDVPGSALQAIADSNKPRLMPLLLALARKPGEMGALLRLSGHYRGALDTLTRAGHQLDPDFAS